MTFKVDGKKSDYPYLAGGRGIERCPKRKPMVSLGSASAFILAAFFGGILLGYGWAWVAMDGRF
jgi:hypothetical protein